MATKVSVWVALAASGARPIARKPARVEPPHGVVEVDANASWSVPLVAGTDLLSLLPRSALRLRVSQPVRVLELEKLRLLRKVALFSQPGTYQRH